MKALKVLFAAAAALLLAAACQKYDDSALAGRVSSLEQKMTSIEAQIASLKEAIDRKVTVDKVEQTATGWTIYLTDNTTLNLTNGKDGADGKDGQNGKDGAPGKDGVDGKDGAPGIDGKDGKDGADGKDGQNGKDGADGKDGQNGKDGAPGIDGKDGKDGQDGDTFFKDVVVEGGYVKIILNDEAETTFVLPMAKRIVIGTEDEEYIEAQYGKAVKVSYQLPDVEISTVAATVLYSEGSTTDVMTKAAVSPWTVKVESETSLEITVDNAAEFKDAILQVTAIAKDGTTFITSKLMKITGLCYHNDTYGIVKLADGKVWMAENLRYVPEGCTPCSDLNNVTAGIYFPVVMSEDKTKAVFGTAEDAKERGYLYQSEIALGLKVGDITTVEQAQALEGTRGICPEGWHIPTIDDITGLVGKAISPIVTNTEAPYYNGKNGSIKLLNDDGFNVSPSGAVSITDNTKTVATLMGFLKNYDTITSGYICGSSYAGVTIKEEKITNVQFWGLMPMSNKATVEEYTINGAKLSYRIAASVRCVKNN